MLWSKTVRKRQLIWFGHMIILPSDCPAKISLKYALEPTAKPKGSPQTTWLSMMIKRFKELNMNWDQACVLAEDRSKWNRFIALS